MNETLTAYLLEKVAEEKKLLEEARRDAAEAERRVRLHSDHVDAYERTLEIETAETANPYVRQSTPVVQFPRVEVEYRYPRKPALPPPPSKRRTVYATVVANPGLKPSEIHRAIPADCPLDIDLATVHRNLGRLKAEGKIYAKGGRYYTSEQSSGEAINESEATG